MCVTTIVVVLRIWVLFKARCGAPQQSLTGSVSHLITCAHTY